MHTKDLQNIGKSLYRELSPLKHSSRLRDPEGTGAGGDRTYHIDRLAEEIIILGLEALKEPLTLISEEAGVIHLHGGGTVVLVDPIDGSRNAVNGIPFYGASIVAAKGTTAGDIYLAYVINLVNGDAFWATKGHNAFFLGNTMQGQKEEEFSVVAYEASSPSRDLPAIVPLLRAANKIRCMGATALDLAYVACGSVSAFVTASASRSFDFAGGFLLLKESGGIITDMQGNDLDILELGLNRSTSLLAAGNGVLHKKALALLNG